MALFGDAHLGVMPSSRVGFGGVEEALFGGRWQSTQMCAQGGMAIAPQGGFDKSITPPLPWESLQFQSE